MAFTKPLIAANDLACSKSATIDVGTTKTVQTVTQANDSAAVTAYQQLTDTITFTDSKIVTDNDDNVVQHVPPSAYPTGGSQTGVFAWVIG